MDGDYSQFLAKLGAEVNGAEGENGAAKQDTADSAPSFSNSLEEFLMSHVAESGRLRPSGAACGKKGASGRMQRPLELVPMGEGSLKAA